MEHLELWLPWERFVSDRTNPESQAAFDSVTSRHREPQRHYHTEAHVVWVIRHLDSFDHPDLDRRTAVAAAFYHDAIYDPSRDDNERLSAELAFRSLLQLGWDQPDADQVSQVIVATAQHEPSHDVTTAAFTCADLGVLAADPTDYLEYANQVRREYGFMADADWRAGRRRVLEGFLAREAIFDVRIAPADWEARARGNMTAELAQL